MLAGFSSSVTLQMSIMGGEEQEAPFFVPFLAALAFGIPVCVLWFFVAEKAGIVANAITLLLGVACGLGARLAASGWHPATAAVSAALILIAFCSATITVQVIAGETNSNEIATVLALIEKGDINSFLNDLVRTSGRTFISYPVGLYLAYRAADGS